MPQYVETFNFCCSPFSATPDTRFFVETSQEESLFNLLINEVNKDDGVARVIGEAGSGKTILCRRLLNALRCHKKRYKVVHIPSPHLSEEGLYSAIAHELDLKHSSKQANLRKNVIAHFTKQIVKNRRKTVIVIDEAQSMPDKTLRALLKLMNHNVAQSKLLRVVLFSMPIESRLKHLPANSQLQEHITFEKELSHLDSDEVKRYIQARLKRAGNSEQTLYSSEAIKLIAKGSNGVPRLINLLAHKSLLNAHEAKLQQVQVPQVQQAIATTEFRVNNGNNRKPNWLSRLQNKGA